MIQEIGTFFILSIFLIYIYLVRKILKTQTEQSESVSQHSVHKISQNIEEFQKVEPQEKPTPQKPECFRFLASQPDTFDITKSPHPCGQCQWIKECV